MRLWSTTHKTEQKDSEPSVYRMLLPSVLGVFLCMACLVGSTFAWYTASSSSQVQSLRSANYTVTATLSSAEVTEASAIPLQYDLQEGSYTLTLTGAGTAERGGYCLLRFGTAPQYTICETQTLLVGDSIQIPLTVHQATSLQIMPMWGTPLAGEDTVLVKETGYTYGTPSPAPAVVPTSETTATPAEATETPAVTAAPAEATETPAVTTAPAEVTETPTVTAETTGVTEESTETTASAEATETPAVTTAPAEATEASTETTASAEATETPTVTTETTGVTETPAEATTEAQSELSSPEAEPAEREAMPETEEKQT